ncbi:MAG TPA: SGNH/GDSL hydrolase family protein [Thermoanaerobaculia bacterium]
MEFAPELGWQNRRNVRLRHRQPDFDVMVQLDAEGHRVTPGGSSGPPIVFVGDSITFGWGVDARDTFVSRVGHALDRRTVNLGVPGYGTDQSYLALMHHGRQSPLNSALVIYTLTANDVFDVTQDRMYGRGKPRININGTIEPFRSSGFPLGWIEQRSYLLASIRTGIDMLSRKPQSQPERARGARLVAFLVEQMRQQCEAAGADFLLVVPKHEILAGETPTGAREVDLGPAIERIQRTGRSLVFREDRHFNAAGHAVVASEILASLADSTVSP